MKLTEKAAVNYLTTLPLFCIVLYNVFTTTRKTLDF